MMLSRSCGEFRHIAVLAICHLSDNGLIGRRQWAENGAYGFVEYVGEDAGRADAFGRT